VSAFIAASVTLCAALIVGALPSTAGADSVGSLQAKANLISEELVQAQLEVDGYQQQYSVASARVSADQEAIAATQAQIISDRHKIAQSTHDVEQLALMSYVLNGGESTSAEAGLFSEDVRTVQATNEYADIAVGDLNEAVATLHTDQKAVGAELVTLNQQESRDQGEAAAQATYLGQANATSQALSGLKAQVTGQLAQAVAQASLARAAAAAAAVTHAENGSNDPTLNKFLLCVRWDESRDDYQAVSPNGEYRGAFQFAQPTWNYAAEAAGRPDLVGVLPNTASKPDQDAMAVTLYSLDGERPWLGDRCNSNGAY
jgi:predicted  nucleic acid-binding Zn-ribbon protein